MVIKATKNLYIWKHEYDVKKIFLNFCQIRPIVARNSGQQLWPVTLVSNYSQPLWLKTVAGNCGGQLWPEIVADNCGQQLWPATVANYCSQ
jgi:hypothetical protein